jgi:hypothetical protein
VAEGLWKASMWVTASWVQIHSLYKEKMLLKGAFCLLYDKLLYLCSYQKKIEGTI